MQHKHISTTINCPLNMCFDLNPESGTQLCLKAAVVSFSSNHNEHLAPTAACLPACLPPILKQITSTLTTINTVESREWAGKIKHHHDPKGRRLKKPILMSGNYVFMKAANTEPTGKSSELDQLCEGERHNNYCGRSFWQWACSIISYMVCQGFV